MQLYSNRFNGLRGHACTSTADGRPVSLTALVTKQEDLETVSCPPAHGIGLDTDFMFAQRKTLPGEKELYAVFNQAVQLAGNRPVNIKLFSLTARQMPQVDPPAWEINPDLGLKGLRLGLQKPEILQPLLKAALRANVSGHVHLLLPMVSKPSEVRQFKALLTSVQQELEEEGISHRPIPEIGVLADLPSVIIDAELFAFDVSFFQVGAALKNYLLGTDFATSCLPHLQHDFEPTFLRQIWHLAEKATIRNKTVSVSLPLASYPEAIPILLAVGVQDFVTNITDLDKIKELVNRFTIAKAKAIAAKAMSYHSGKEAQLYAQEALQKYL